MTASEYEFKLDLYHNNYVNMQTIAKGLDGAKAAESQKMIALYQELGVKAVAQEAEVFQAGVEAAGGDAKKFLKDVLESYPDMKDSERFKGRLQQAGLTDIGINERHKTQRNDVPKLAFTQTAVVVTAAIADYKEASEYIKDPIFNYLTEEAKSEYPHVYASAKIQQNTFPVKHELGYSGFRDWALKVNLHEEDWVKLDPTPVTKNHISIGLPAMGISDPLQDLGRTY